MLRRFRFPLLVIGAASLFAAGFAAGQAAKFHFGQPKTILQISILKFHDGVTEAQEADVLNGVKRMAGEIPGIKNVWIKADHLDPRNFDAAFVIEFASREAADNYAESPVHAEWSRKLQQIREASISPQITNP